MIAFFSILFASVLSLNGEWELDFWPQPVTGAVRELPIKVPFETLSATVPGNCELELIKAGRLPKPEKGLNVLQLRPYEGYQWLYTKTFEVDQVLPKDGSRAMLVFEGIDTLADVFLNGEKIGESANMLIPRRFDVTRRIRPGRNTVQVLLRSIAIEAQEKSVGELGYSLGVGGLADGEHFRKAAYMGGWDIFPRVFVAGLWRGVSLVMESPVRIDETAWIVGDLDVTNGSARLDVRFRVQAPFERVGRGTVRAALMKDDREVAFVEKPFNGYLNGIVWRVERGLECWWPRGMGAPTLYDAVIEVRDESGRTLARHTEKIGIRTVRLERDDVYDAKRPGQFLLRINGEPVYVRGSNWVPTDSFPSRQATRTIETLELFRDLNCNLVRVWGGGVYESDAFFDWCDANGLMVWQDFMTGCSSFPQEDDYAAVTAEEVRCVVLRLRNRASLVLWSGNNENDEALFWKLPREYARNPNDDRSSRRTIPGVLFNYDVTRPYLPSSPYLSPDVVAGKAKPSESHLWGERAYYKDPYYTNSPCWFASEMGYHGCPNVESLKKMMTPEGLYPWMAITGRDPWTNYQWNAEWTLKASNPFLDKTSWGGMRRNSLMVNQTQILFGETPTNLVDFVQASQIVQAEAMKTFCELFRSRKFTRFNGLVWWNVRDGWPQISDAVVDWYGGKKLAYAALRNAQRDQIVCIVDDGSVWAINDEMREIAGEIAIRDRETGKTVLSRSFVVPANGKTRLGSVSLIGRGLMLIEGVLAGERYRNHFLYGEPPFDLGKVREWLDLAD